jgi:hypothetical protein
MLAGYKEVFEDDSWWPADVNGAWRYLVTWEVL